MVSRDQVLASYLLGPYIFLDFFDVEMCLLNFSILYEILLTFGKSRTQLVSGLFCKIQIPHLVVYVFDNPISQINKKLLYRAIIIKQIRLLTEEQLKKPHSYLAT